MILSLEILRYLVPNIFLSFILQGQSPQVLREFAASGLSGIPYFASRIENLMKEGIALESRSERTLKGEFTQELGSFISGQNSFEIQKTDISGKP